MLNDKQKLYLESNLPFFTELSVDEKNKMFLVSSVKKYTSGELIHIKDSACTGLVLVLDGQLRSFVDYQDTKEITLFRLLERDLCILSASCVFKNMSYDINLEAEKNSTVIIIDGTYFNELASTNLHVSKFLFDLTQNKLSDVMWVIEQVVFLSFDNRLSNFLLDQYYLENTTTLTMTHDTIARNLGSAREVVSRMLKRFENDGIVKLSRGTIELINLNELKALSS